MTVATPGRVRLVRWSTRIILLLLALGAIVGHRRLRAAGRAVRLLIAGDEAPQSAEQQTATRLQREIDRLNGNLRPMPDQPPLAQFSGFELARQQAARGTWTVVPEADEVVSTVRHAQPPKIARSQLLKLHLRFQRLVRDRRGRNTWKTITETRYVPATQTAIIVCDMWDRVFGEGMTERIAEMAARMNAVVTAARRRGVTILHAPEGVIDYYANTPARRRVQNAPSATPPAPPEYDFCPPTPVSNATTNSSDTNQGDEEVVFRGTRQIDTIEIDQEVDGIADDGREIYSFFKSRGIRYVVIMGVHTQVCVLDRSYGIKNLVWWDGMEVFLCRELTDASYNPACPPYVSQAEGTRLAIEYIEKFYCPSISSSDLKDLPNKTEPAQSAAERGGNAGGECQRMTSSARVPAGSMK